VETVLGTLDDDDTLREEGVALKDAIQDVMERHFTGPECQGLCRGLLTIQTVQAPMGRIAGETGAPSANTRTMMSQARAAADTITAEVSALMSGDVASYRATLKAAGYTPFGNGSNDE